jgi:WD40-like Beta Propeller Repeat
VRISPRHPILSRRSSESTSYVLAALRALHVATFLDGGMSAVRREAVERKEAPWFTAEHQSLRVNRTGAGPKNSMSWRQTVQTDSASQDTGKRPLAPSWSPDGTQIAFTSDGWKENSEIYVMNSDGSNLINVTSNGSP